MRKGDDRKQEILSVAEKLFCSRGYDATSVQDILDVLHCSKGGFYHHFISKESVLDTLCVRHAEKARDAALSAMQETDDALARLNRLFYSMIPMHKDDFRFMSMLLPLLDRPESTAVRVRFQEALLSAFLPVLEQELSAAREKRVIYPPVKRIATPVLTLLNQCWFEAAQLMIDGAKKAQRIDSGALLGTLEQYRRCIEVLLDAPYGGIVLVDYQEWDALADILINQMRLGG